MAIIDVDTHVPVKGYDYFFDCMIWMYLCSPHGGYNRNNTRKYSRLQGEILTAGANILITDVLISEFVNTYIRTEYYIMADLHGFPKTKDYFKNSFKYTEHYRNIIDDLKLILEREIFTCTKRKDIAFSSIDMSNIFDNPQTFDFNDKYYGLNFEKEPVYIVTHDGDFANVPSCDIITANPTLLAATQATVTPTAAVVASAEPTAPDIDEEITL